MRSPAERTERELRFSVGPGFVLAPKSHGNAGVRQDSIELVDIWYIPRHVASYREHEAWLRSGRAAPVRVRIGGFPSRCAIELKMLQIPGDFSVARELSLPVDDVWIADSFLKALGFVRVAALRKKRTTVDHSAGLVVSVDDYGDHGVVLEIEISDQSGSRFDAALLRTWALDEFGPDLEDLTEPIALRAIRTRLEVLGDANLDASADLLSDAELGDVVRT